MRSRRIRPSAAAAAATLALLATGCGRAPDAEHIVLKHTTALPRQGLRVGVVGDIGFRVPGAYADFGPLTRVVGAPLVLVDARSTAAATVAAAARAHPRSHFALVGASARALKIPNLVGLLVRDDQAAHVAGLLAGLVARAAGTTRPAVALVGPGEDTLLVAFTEGAHAVDARVDATGYPAGQLPASCKEAALAAIASGALAVVGTAGPCAIGVRAAALEQHVVGQSIDDFEIFDAAAASTVRQAVHGIYAGAEDITFGARAGAIGITRLDPLVTAAVAVQARAAAQRYTDGPG